MKNQYVGDAGDHGKYGMLRYLENKGISIAVNWYLTKDDGTNDGKHTGYLKKKEERVKDPALFDLLKQIILENRRDVLEVETSGLFGDTSFYHEILDVSDCKTVEEKQQKRYGWHQQALAACSGKELVFLDPDNGLKEPTTQGLGQAVKYCFVNEVADYYKNGQNIVYYCSKARRKEEAWTKYKKLMLATLPEAKLLGITFHGGTQRSYIFVIHPEDYDRYEIILAAFLISPWKTGNNHFTKEPIQ